MKKRTLCLSGIILALAISLASPIVLSQKNYCAMGYTGETLERILKNFGSEENYMVALEEAVLLAGGAIMAQPFLNDGTIVRAEDGVTIRKGMNGAVNPVNESSAQPSDTKPQPTPEPKKKCSHVYNSTITKESNCTEEGVRTYTCEICGDTYEAPEATNDQHDYEEEHKEPTCTEDGYNKKTCKLCGNEVVETLEATWHDYKTVTEKEPSCTEAGKEVQTCTVCGDKVEKELPALGHEHGGWNVTKEAGWFTQGEQESRCSVCNEILETQVIESRYPAYYLYIAIILAVVIIAAAITTAITTRKRKK